jgi:hypothetical protein
MLSALAAGWVPLGKVVLRPGGGGVHERCPVSGLIVCAAAACVAGECARFFSDERCASNEARPVADRSPDESRMCRRPVRDSLPPMWRWVGTELVRDEVRVVACAECGCLSGLRWAGWRAYRVDDPEYDEQPMLGFYCPACVKAEFG